MAAGVVLGAVLIGYAAAVGLTHWQSVPSTWDAVWHANEIRYILDTGQASSTHMGELRNVETHDPLYYPSAFHALAAVLSQLTGIAPTTAYTRQLGGGGRLAVSGERRGADVAARSGPRTTEWRTAGCAAAAAAMSASFTAVPYIEFDTASMPNLVAYGIAAPTMVLIVSALAHRDRIPVAVLALLGVFSVHTTGGHRRRAVRRGVVGVRRAVAPGSRPGGRRGDAARGGHSRGVTAAAAVRRDPQAGRHHRRARVRHPRGQEEGAVRRGRRHTPATSTTSRSSRDCVRWPPSER